MPSKYVRLFALFEREHENRKNYIVCRFNETSFGSEAGNSNNFDGIVENCFIERHNTNVCRNKYSGTKTSARRRLCTFEGSFPISIDHGKYVRSKQGRITYYHTNFLVNIITTVRRRYCR